jgi:hypothetical protein
MLKKGDIALVILLVIAVIAGLAGIRFYRGSMKGDRIAVIKQENKVIREINLDEVQEAERLSLTGDYNNIILIEKGRIRFEESDCPDLVCVHTGWLDKTGSFAACLPNKSLIMIKGEGEEVDGATY